MNIASFNFTFSKQTYSKPETSGTIAKAPSLFGNVETSGTIASSSSSSSSSSSCGSTIAVA